MGLINVTETTLFEQLKKIIDKRDICKCERCRLDIAAIALNKLPPNYVVTTEGEVVRAISPQLKIDVQRELENAISLVAKRPHHERMKP
ncbi:MAG: late competence development ComFB family protein [Desulfocucumaceae bacterium]